MNNNNNNRSIGTKHQRDEDDDNEGGGDGGLWEDCSSDFEEQEDNHNYDTPEEDGRGGNDAEVAEVEDAPPPPVIHTTSLLLPALEIKEVKPKKEKKEKKGALPPPPNAFHSDIMCASVAELMRHAHHYGYIRSAGRRGFDAWEILVAAGRVPLCVDAISYKKPTAKQVRQGTLSQLVPLGISTLRKHPASKFKPKKNTPAMAVVVVHLGPLEERGWMSKFNIRDARRFRFICDPQSNIVSLPKGTQFSQKDDVSIEVIGGGNVTTIDSYCLEYTSSISDVIINLPQLTEIGDDFCVKAHGLETIQITLQNVTVIGDQFLAGCLCVERLDLSHMKSVVSIGDRFMVNCSGLQHLNLSGMSKITYIGDSFLYLCASLISVDFPKKLTGEASSIDIPETFMAFCRRLQSVDVTWMGDTSEDSNSNEFLLECNDIEYVSLAPFSLSTVIQNDFLSHTSSLKTINLSPLRNVRSIGDRFLFNCGVETIDLGPLVAVEVIGADFMGGDSTVGGKCDMAKMERLAKMSKTERVLPGNSFMSCFSAARKPFSTIRCGGSGDLSGLNPVVLAALRLTGFNV